MATDQYDSGYAAGARQATKREFERYAEIDMQKNRKIARLERENKALLKALGDMQDVINPDAVRDGISQAFAEIPEQIYNAISEAVFSHLQQNGVQCPRR